ncbi:MAG TPA: hypothetical protein VM925_00090 [Labilithrix sp.]|nr:hypothetical protein [Labilithrix sp.]
MRRSAANRGLSIVVVGIVLAACAHGDGRRVDRANGSATPAASNSDVASMFWGTVAQFDPEEVPIGIAGVEPTDVVDLAPDREERETLAYAETQRKIAERVAREADPSVVADLEVARAVLRAREDRATTSARLEIGYVDVHRVVQEGLSAVFATNPIRSAERAVAHGRLSRYAGSSGAPSVPARAIARIRQRMSRPGVIFPPRARVERDLSAGPALRKDIAMLVRQQGVPDADALLARLDAELASYEDFVREKVLPRARSDFRSSPELYAIALREYGIDTDPRTLAREARAAFAKTQTEIQLLATRLAAGRVDGRRDYRDVLRALRHDQLGARTLETYEERARTIDAILRREGLLDVPDVPLRIRFATPAESAAVPMPFMKGEIGPARRWSSPSSQSRGSSSRSRRVS